MKVKCPHCGYIAMSPDQSVGNEMECPQCKNLHVAKAYEVDVMADGAPAMKITPPSEPIVLSLFGWVLIILSVLSVPLTLGRVGFVAAVGTVFWGVIAGLVLITLANIQWHVQKTAYWAKRTHEELRRQNKVKS